VGFRGAASAPSLTSAAWPPGPGYRFRGVMVANSRLFHRAPFWLVASSLGLCRTLIGSNEQRATKNDQA
jgi:hypothetical protein